MSKANVLLLY